MVYTGKDFTRWLDMYYGNVYIDADGVLWLYLGETEDGRYQIYPLLTVRFYEAENGLLKVSHEEHMRYIAEAIVYDMLRKNTEINRSLLQVVDKLPNFLVGHSEKPDKDGNYLDYPSFRYIYEDRNKLKKKIGI